MHNQGKLNEALEAATALEKEFPNNYLIYSILGVILNDLKKYDEAIINLKKSIEINPDFALAYYNLGESFKSLINNNQAIVNFKKAIDCKPDFSEAHNNLGGCLMSLGEFEEACISYRNSIKLNPNQFQAYYNLAHSLQYLNQNEDAIINYKKSIKNKPDFSQAHNNLGNVLDKIGKYEDAILCYQEAIKLSPNYYAAHNNLANTYKNMGRYLEAIEKYDESKTVASKAQILECLYKLEKYEDLKKRLSDYVKSDKKNIRIAAVSAFISNQLKQKDPYPFCKNPLDFFNLSNLKNHKADSNKFIEEILLEAKNIKTIWEPQNKTTKLGFQTDNTIFEAGKNCLELKNIIEKEIESYKNKFISEDCIFINSWPREFEIKGWFVRLKKNGHQTSHIHPGGWISGVIYLRTIESSSESNEGAIELGLHGYDLPLINENYPKKIYKPKNGDILLFPSSLFHRTIPFTTDNERCVIGFDLQPNSYN